MDNEESVYCNLKVKIKHLHQVEHCTKNLKNEVANKNIKLQHSQCLVCIPLISQQPRNGFLYIFAKWHYNFMSILNLKHLSNTFYFRCFRKSVFSYLFFLLTFFPALLKSDVMESFTWMKRGMQQSAIC